MWKFKRSFLLANCWHQQAVFLIPYDVLTGTPCGGSPGLLGAVLETNILSFSLVFSRYNHDLSPAIFAHRMCHLLNSHQAWYFIPYNIDITQYEHSFLKCRMCYNIACVDLKLFSLLSNIFSQQPKAKWQGLHVWCLISKLFIHEFIT